MIIDISYNIDEKVVFMMIDSNTTLEVLFEIAKKTLNELNMEEEFIVKELFRGFEWNRIAKGNRITLGSMFLNFSLVEGEKIIKKLDKTSQNQQRYLKIV